MRARGRCVSDLWAVAATMLACNGASAQCREWLPEARNSESSIPITMASVRHPGSDRAMLYASVFDEEVPSFEFLSRWDGDRWTFLSLLDFRSDRVRLLRGIASDAVGIPGGSLFMAGRFAPAAVPIRHVAIFDGVAWHALGGTAPGDFVPASPYIGTSIVWDSDGEGPHPTRLIVGGDFTRIGGTDVAYLAAWSGESWEPVGPPVHAPVGRLHIHDFDGEGPEPARLIAQIWGGSNNVYVLRDAHWTPLGSEVVGGVVTHDPDGDGPLPASLYAPHATHAVARWDGEAWVPVSDAWPPNLAFPSFLHSYDPDGPGPAPAQLIAMNSSVLYGGDSRTVVILEGDTWVIPPGSPLDGHLRTPSDQPRGLTSVTEHDPDGDGPRGTELIVGGHITHFSTPYQMNYRHHAMWNGSRFGPLGDHFISGNDLLGAFYFAAHDPDGDGPLPPRLIISGGIRLAGGRFAEGIAEWDGHAWRGLGTPGTHTYQRVGMIASFDPDGIGPEPPVLLAAFASFPGQFSRWNGETWEMYGPPGAFNIFDFVAFDPDGDGPSPPRIFAAGQHPNSTVVMLVENAWVPAGAPRTDPFYDLHVHDFDGDGPMPAQLFATTLTGSLLRWTGAGWAPFGGVTGMFNYDHRIMMTSLDPDGDGPMPSELVLGSDTIVTPQGTFRGAAGFDGERWRAHATSGVNGPIRVLITFDPDGRDGPVPPTLVCMRPSGSDRQSFILVNGQWQALGIGGFGMQGYVPGVVGPGPGELFIAGTFTQLTDGTPRMSFARLRVSTPVAILAPPAWARTPLGDDLTLSVETLGTVPRFAWSRNGVLVREGAGGASPGGGVVSGATTGVLTISGAACTDAGAYAVIVSNSCGSTATHDPVFVRVDGCPCDPDVNADGVADMDDLACLAQGVAGDLSCITQSPDFNDDGNTDQDDIAALAAVIAGAECP